MKKRPSITLLTALLAVVFAAGIGVYSSYIGMKIYQESSDHLLESFSQISKTFTLFVQRNWTVLSQWDDLMSNAPDDENIDSIGADMQANKESWHYSDFYLFNESTQYLTADGRRGSVDSISGVIQEMYSEGGPIVSTYTASYGVPKIVFAMPLSRNMTLDGVTYTGLAVSYDTDVVDDLVDGSMYGGKSDCYIVRANGDIVLALEPQTELCEGMTNLYDIDAHADWIYGSMDDIKDCVQLGRSGSAQFICQGGRNYLVAIPTAFPDWTLVGIIRADEVDGAMHSVQQSTIIALGALCIFAVIIVVLALGMESQLRLRREEEERLSLEREKMQSDRLLQSMSRIVDRYSIINLDTDRYRYRELRNSEPLYPASGRYSDMVETISRRYVALTETENAKLSRLITPEYLRSVLRRPDDNLKIEYCSLNDDTPIIILTAYDWSDIEVEARAAGVTAFCSKPMFLSDLRDTLLTAIGHAAPAAAAEPDVLPEAQADFRGRRVLLVEDNELNREIAVEILHEYGFLVDTAENGATAVDKVQTSPADRYDLVLMDIQMPVMDGYTATRRIRALNDPARAAVPIVAMTANVFEEERKRAFDCGMNGFLSKPLVIEALISALRDILR